jgi:hypothetical protein
VDCWIQQWSLDGPGLRVGLIRGYRLHSLWVQLHEFDHRHGHIHLQRWYVREWSLQLQWEPKPDEQLNSSGRV